MKKVALLVACIGVLFFASCTEEVLDLLKKKPQVEFVKDAEHPSDAYSIMVGESITFTVQIAPNEETNAALKEFIFTIKNPSDNDAVVFEDRQTITEDLYATHVFEETFTATETGNYTVTATVKDENDAENVAAVYLDCASPIVDEIGTFKGVLKIAGGLTVDNPLTGPAELSLDATDVDVTVTLGNTAEDGVAEAQLNIDGSLVTLQCQKDNGTFRFDTFHFTKPIDLVSLATVEFDIEITDMVGVLDGDVLNVTAKASGDGSFMLSLLTATVKLDGTMEGPLDKMKE